MTTLFLLLVVLALLDVTVRHKGNASAAWAEVVGFVRGLVSALVPYLRRMVVWAGHHKLPLGILVVSIIVIWVMFISPALAPKIQPLMWGPNDLEDKCGGSVVLWVLPDGATSEPGRLEVVVPRDAGKSVRILSPGADPNRCAWEMPIIQR